MTGNEFMTILRIALRWCVRNKDASTSAFVRHPREGEDPVPWIHRVQPRWIPAFAGMTGTEYFRSGTSGGSIFLLQPAVTESVDAQQFSDGFFLLVFWHATQ